MSEISKVLAEAQVVVSAVQKALADLPAFLEHEAMQLVDRRIWGGVYNATVQTYTWLKYTQTSVKALRAMLEPFKANLPTEVLVDLVEADAFIEALEKICVDLEKLLSVPSGSAIVKAFLPGGSLYADAKDAVAVLSPKAPTPVTKGVTNHLAGEVVVIAQKQSVVAAPSGGNGVPTL